MSSRIMSLLFPCPANSVLNDVIWGLHNTLEWDIGNIYLGFCWKFRVTLTWLLWHWILQNPYLIPVYYFLDPPGRWQYLEINLKWIVKSARIKFEDLSWLSWVSPLVSHDFPYVQYHYFFKQGLFLFFSFFLCFSLDLDFFLCYV